MCCLIAKPLLGCLPTPARLSPAFDPRPRPSNSTPSAGYAARRGVLAKLPTPPPNSTLAQAMQSGGGVLCVAALSLVSGLCLLGIYEGYKTHFFNNQLEKKAEDEPEFRHSLGFTTPLDYLFYLATANNTFAVFGLMGAFLAQRELIVAFFIYNIAQMVLAFNWFVDVCADLKIRYVGETSSLNPYERAAAAFLFFTFALSVAATYFAVKAVQELRQKQREAYNLTGLADTLHFEPDG